MFESKFEWQELLNQAVEQTEDVVIKSKTKNELEDLF